MDARFLLAVAGQTFWLALGAFLFIAFQFAFVDWPLDIAMR